jgi:TonB family protein
MRLPISAVLLSLLLPTGAETQQKTVPPGCSVELVHAFYPKVNTLITEYTYKRSPIVRFLIQEDGSVSGVRIVRSSGVADIDKKVVDAVSQWKYKPRPTGCGVIESKMTILIHSGIPR